MDFKACDVSFIEGDIPRHTHTCQKSLQGEIFFLAFSVNMWVYISQGNKIII